MARNKIIMTTFEIILPGIIIYRNHRDTLCPQVPLDLLIWKLCIFYKTQISTFTEEFPSAWRLLILSLQERVYSYGLCGSSQLPSTPQHSAVTPASLWNTKSTVLWGCMVHASHSLSNFLILSVEKVAWSLCSLLLFLSCFSLDKTKCRT